MPRCTARPPSRIAKLLTWLLLGLVVILGWRALSSSAPFKVSEVVVRGDPGHLVTDQLTAQILGQNLIFLPADEIRRNVRQNLLISSVSLGRQFPGRVVASFDSPQPVLS